MAVCLAWCLWPEYGSGYSEDQRRLWNERRRIYPVAWRVDAVFPSKGARRPPPEDVATLTGVHLDSHELKSIEFFLKQKKRREQELDRQLMANRNKSAPDYDAAEPLKVDMSRLPLEGLTEREIAERALAGDGDACLKMVQYLCGHVNYTGLSGLSWREKREAERWMEMAVAVKRPGAEFVESFFRKAWEIQKRVMEEERYAEADLRLELKDIPGYSDYVECLTKGDFLLFETVDKMFFDGMPSYNQRHPLSGEARLLYNVLLKEARLGKVVAQRNLASFCFGSRMFGQDDELSDRIAMEVEEQISRWNRWLQIMPISWKAGVMEGLLSCGIIDADKTPAMKRYYEASRYARQAARQGDLTGMYLWLRHGIGSLAHFSEQQWDEIFMYNRLLFESGYAPYVMNVNERAGDNFPDEAVLKSFYSEKSYASVRQKDYTVCRGRIKGWPDREIINKGDLEETRKRVEVLRLTGRTDLLLDNLTGVEFGSGGLLDEASVEVRGYLVKQMQKWAGEGDLLAIYTLAGLYEKGIGVPADPGRAYALYGQAFDGTKDHPARVSAGVSGVDFSGRNAIVSMPASMRTFICLRRALMVLEYPDFPGRNAKEAYERLMEVSLGNTLFGYRGYSVLGLFHEWGVGVPVDWKKALEFYKKGRLLDDACQENVRRHSELVNSKGQ